MSGQSRILRYFLVLGILFGGRAGAQALDELLVTSDTKALGLLWADAEERIQGTLAPAPLRAGDEMSVNLHVGSFQGTFDGPIEIVLRRPGAPVEVHTVKKEATRWHTAFKLEDAGPHTLDVRFRTTREKVVHARFEVGEPRVPPYVLWLLLGGAAAVALGLGTYQLLARNERGTPASPP